MGRTFAYYLKAFDNNVLFNMPNDTMTFVPYQPFDFDIILKVTGDQTNFKVAVFNRVTKLQ